MRLEKFNSPRFSSSFGSRRDSTAIVDPNDARRFATLHENENSGRTIVTTWLSGSNSTRGGRLARGGPALNERRPSIPKSVVVTLAAFTFHTDIPVV